MKLPLIFQPEFILGSVTNQEQLDTAFIKYPNYSKEYLATALYRADTRKWYEENWPKLYKYLDQNFLTEFKKEEGHNKRAWEFHLGAALLKNGFKLENTTEYGPDFLIYTAGKRIWIEAVTCDLGVTDAVEPRPVLTSGQFYSHTGNIEETNRPRALRITNSILEKRRRFEKYLDDPKSGVKSGDCLVVAVNGAEIQHYSYDRALFKRAVFGQGVDTFFRDPQSGNLVGPYYKPTDSALKRGLNGEKEIATNCLELKEYSILSAVIYTGDIASHCWNNGYELGDRFFLGHHSTAINPLPDGALSFGIEIKKDKNGVITEKSYGRAKEFIS